MIIVVNKRSNRVVDIGQKYDDRFFDHMDLPDGTIPSGEDFHKYKRDDSGNIVKMSKDELTREFMDEWKADLKSRIDGLLAAPEVKAILKEMVDKL